LQRPPGFDKLGGRKKDESRQGGSCRLGSKIGVRADPALRLLAELDGILPSFEFLRNRISSSPAIAGAFR